MIKVKSLSKAYKNTMVLNDVSLEIADGEIYGLVGESGVGKSTLLGCLNGLEQYQQGSVDVDGTRIEALNEKELRKFRKTMGMIFQNFSLVQRKNVYQNIAIPMECWGVPKDKIKERVYELARLVGMEEKLNSRPSELSGGQKQRVAIARALTMNPKYLLCDECTSALDPKMTQSILKLLASIRKKMGITIIMVTHEMSVVQQICDRMAILEEGRVAVAGDVFEIFTKRPAAFQKFLGTDGRRYEGTGRTISFNLFSDDVDSPFLYQMSQKLNLEYAIVDSQFYEFSGRKYCNLSIHVANEDADRTCSYLKESGLIYQLEEKGDN